MPQCLWHCWVRPLKRPLLWIAIIAALSVPSLRWTASLAKNDIGVCFWALAALIPLRAGQGLLTCSSAWSCGDCQAHGDCFRVACDDVLQWAGYC